MDKSHVSIEQHQCYICGTTFDTGNLLLHKRLKQTLDHHTITDFDICQDCQEKLDEDYIALVAIEPLEESRTAAKAHEPVRTGDMAWLKREAAVKVFEGHAETIRNGLHMVFVDPAVLDHLKSMVSSE